MALARQDYELVVNLPDEVYDFLRKVARETKEPLADLLSRALGNEAIRLGWKAPSSVQKFDKPKAYTAVLHLLAQEGPQTVQDIAGRLHLIDSTVRSALAVLQQRGDATPTTISAPSAKGRRRTVWSVK